MKLKLKINSRRRGFTIVESLVAITVLLVGVVGPLGLSASAISDGIFARNQLTANYLAQEAMEVVINKRYALARRAQYLPPDSGQTIFNGYVDTEFSSCITTSGGGGYCTVDPQVGSISVCASPYTACQFVYDNNTGLYKSRSTPNISPLGPIFTRRVQITNTANPNEVKVTVRVDWNNKATEKSLILVEHLFSQG